MHSSLFQQLQNSKGVPAQVSSEAVCLRLALSIKAQVLRLSRAVWLRLALSIKVPVLRLLRAGSRLPAVWRQQRLQAASIKPRALRLSRAGSRLPLTNIRARALRLSPAGLQQQRLPVVSTWELPQQIQRRMNPPWKWPTKMTAVAKMNVKRRRENAPQQKHPLRRIKLLTKRQNVPQIRFPIRPPLRRPIPQNPKRRANVPRRPKRRVNTSAFVFRTLLTNVEGGFP
jgi:hypothetical protein